MGGNGMKLRRGFHARPLLLAVLALLLAGTPVGAPVAADSPTLSYLPLIYNRHPVGDVSVNRVEVVQGITMSDSYTVHVAHRPALLRVFVNLSGPDHLEGVSARLTRYVGGAPLDTMLAGRPGHGVRRHQRRQPGAYPQLHSAGRLAGDRHQLCIGA